MNLTFTFDLGNTHPHVGIFKNGDLKEVIPLEKFDSDQIGVGIISQVGSEFKPQEFRPIDFISVKEHWNDGKFLEMPVNYEQTLGEDRLYQAYYVYKQILSSDVPSVMLVDSGSFTTIDLIDSLGMRGGYILPGDQRYLQTYTRSRLLPELTVDRLNTRLFDQLPDSTDSAILQSWTLLLVGAYRQFIEKHKPGMIIFTGGNGEVHRGILENLESDLPVKLIPDLIHRALYYLANSIRKEEE